MTRKFARRTKRIAHLSNTTMVNEMQKEEHGKIMVKSARIKKENLRRDHQKKRSLVDLLERIVSELLESALEVAYLPRQLIKTN